MPSAREVMWPKTISAMPSAFIQSMNGSRGAFIAEPFGGARQIGAGRHSADETDRVAADDAAVGHRPRHHAPGGDDAMAAHVGHHQGALADPAFGADANALQRRI